VTLLLVGTFFVLAYGYWMADPTPREATWLLRLSPALTSWRNTGVDFVTAARTGSLVVTSLVLMYCLANVRRSMGWFGVATLAMVMASSPIIATLSTSATPDALLLFALLLPIHRWWASRMARQATAPHMGKWCFVGLFGLLGLGLAGLADILCGRGKIEHVFTNNDPFQIGLSMIMTGSAIYTLLVGTALAGICQRWSEGKTTPRLARWWERGLAFLSIRIPLAALILAIYRMISVYPAMERVHIITACAWMGLVLAIVQVRLRHWEGQFFPILLVAIAVKVVWVHALAKERDIERGSAILARAVAQSIPNGASLESSVPVDSIFAYTMWAGTKPIHPNGPAGHFALERSVDLPPADLIATFRDHRGSPLQLVRREELARDDHSLGTLRR
jgi:hypothetical protein